MKKNKTTLLTLVLLLAALFLSGCSESSTSKYLTDMPVTPQTNAFYVNDFGNFISPEVEEQLLTIAENFNEETGGIQIVIVTTKTLKDAVQDNSLSGYTVEQVATSFYNQYKVGTDSMGVLIYYTESADGKDFDIWMSTGDQMQTYIQDSVARNLCKDNAFDLLMGYDYDNAFLSVQEATISRIKNKVPNNWNEKSKPEKSEEIIPVDKTLQIEEGTTTQETVTPSAADDSTSQSNLLTIILASIFTLLGTVFGTIGYKIKKKINKDSERIQDLDSEKTDLLSQIASLKSTIARNQQDHQTAISALKKTHDDDCANLIKQISSKEQTINQLKGDLAALNSEKNNLTEKLRRIYALYPGHNFDQEIFDMIEREYQAEAQRYDALAIEAYGTEVDRDKISKYDQAIRTLRALPKEVSKYLTFNVDDLVTRRDSAQELIYQDKAEQITAEAVRVFGNETKRENLADYTQELKILMGLAPQIAKYVTFDKNLLFQRRDEAQEMENKYQAKKAHDEIARKFQGKQGSHETYHELNELLKMYQSLSRDVSKHFNDSDLIRRLKSEVDKAKSDFGNHKSATEFNEKLEREFRYIGYSADENDRSKLESLQREYNYLSDSVKKYVDPELIRKLKRYIQEANDDHETKERRRRQAAYSSSHTSSHHSYSSSHHSSFGGGGHSSGHGGGVSGHR